MVTRPLSILLVLLVATFGIARTASAGELSTKEVKKRAAVEAKVKDGIAKLGVGREARVKIQLRDKTKLAGYVSRAGETDFTVTDPETGRSTDVPFADVTKVRGNNLHTGWKIAIGVGILLTVLYILVLTEAIGDAET